MKFHNLNSSLFKNTTLLLSGVVFLSLSSCKTANSTKFQAQSWLTKSDESVKLQQQNPIAFTSASNNFQNIEIDSNQKFQYVDGFGYTLTGGSVDVINQLSPEKRKALLNEIFGNSENSNSVNYLRLSIGASDLNAEVFSYDDIPAGQTDINLEHFSLAKDQPLIDMLKEILAINPNIKIIAAPWSAPVWMKDNGQSKGGSLKPEFYGVYANYFVKYIQAMQKEGISIDAITPQNEPLHPGNNPSLYMPSPQQADFVKNHLGPAFQKANIKTKIVLYDHNLDRPDYPMDILADPEAAKYVDGSAFHLYGGDISAMGKVHDAYPKKNLYFTEQWTGSKQQFSDNLIWHTKNVIIGSMRNWSKIALEWNLANDAEFNPHTPGGCTECKGAITVNSNDTFERNVAYYIIAQVSKFVPYNSVRIASTQLPNISTVAFSTSDKKIVLLAVNDSKEDQNFNIKYNGKWATATLSANAVATYVFDK